MSGIRSMAGVPGDNMGLLGTGAYGVVEVGK